ncbi:MAG: OsmC family protein [Candidatus Thorarchaeota archaeon]
MSENQVFTYEINLKRKEKYKFEVDFGRDTIPILNLDEPKEVPGGEETGPSASMLLGAAIGHCLSASLIFCLEKKRVPLTDIKSKVIVKRQRNEKGFWRVSEIDVELFPKITDDENTDYDRCLEIFRNYCIVSGSVESGIPLNVAVIR